MKKFIFTIILCFFCWSIGMAQNYFDLAKKFPVPGFNPNVSASEITPLKAEQVATAFTFIASKSGMQFKYPQGGCPERALMMNRLLDSMKVSNFKIWIFAPSRMLEGDTRKISVPDKNGLSISTNNRIEWDFHVASCVLEQKAAGKIDTLVFDPSINSDKPMLYKDWLKSITGSQNASYTFTDGKYYSFNRQNNGNSTVINGFFYPYVGWSYDNLILEKMLTLNDVAMAMYQKYVNGKDKNAQDTKVVIQVIENSATLKEVLEYKDGNPASAKIRFLTANYPTFISDAWAMYAQRLPYWSHRVTKMF